MRLRAEGSFPHHHHHHHHHPDPDPDPHCICTYRTDSMAVDKKILQQQSSDAQVEDEPVPSYESAVGSSSVPASASAPAPPASQSQPNPSYPFPSRGPAPQSSSHAHAHGGGAYDAAPVLIVRPTRGGGPDAHAHAGRAACGRFFTAFFWALAIWIGIGLLTGFITDQAIQNGNRHRGGRSQPPAHKHPHTQPPEVEMNEMKHAQSLSGERPKVEWQWEKVVAE